MFKNKKIVALLLLAVMLMLPLANALAIEIEVETDKTVEPAPKSPGPARVPVGPLEDLIVGVPEMKVLPRAGACR